jgi:hypothetical protein
MGGKTGVGAQNDSINWIVFVFSIQNPKNLFKTLNRMWVTPNEKCAEKLCIY